MNGLSLRSMKQGRYNHGGNITTLIEKADAENVSGSDYIYLVQGTGSDRDRKIKLDALFASDPAHTLVVDEQDEYPGHYLIRKFKGNSASSYLDNGDVGFCVVSRNGERSIAGVIENQAVTTDKLANDAVTSPKIASGGVSNGNLANNSVSTEKIINGNVTTAKISDDAVTPEKIDETGDYTVGSITATGSADALDVKGERDDEQHRPQDGGTAHKCDRKHVYCRERLADK